MPYKDIVKRREVDAAHKRAKHARQRDEMFSILGRQCVRCGFNDMRALAIDHKLGGGTKERSMGGGYHSFLLNKLKNGNEDYQILCFNCNQIKKVENKE